MIALHPDTGIAFTNERNAGLIAEAQHERVLQQLNVRPASRRLIGATGRMLERLGERMQ